MAQGFVPFGSFHRAHTILWFEVDSEPVPCIQSCHGSKDVQAAVRAFMNSDLGSAFQLNCADLNQRPVWGVRDAAEGQNGIDPPNSKRVIRVDSSRQLKHRLADDLPAQKTLMERGDLFDGHHRQIVQVDVTSSVPKK